MSAFPAPITPDRSRSETHGPRRASVLLTIALLAGSLQAAAQDPITAVWKERKLSFSYNSSRAVYSCDALADRFKSVLRAVGARDDVKVRVSGCNHSMVPPDPRMEDPMGRSTMDPMNRPTMDPTSRYRDQPTNRRQYVSVYATFMLPTEVTPQVLEELKKDKSRRELLAHVKGDPLLKFSDPVPFTAVRQRVTLSRKTIGVEPEECDLLDEVSATVFRQLGMRVLNRNFNCSPDSQISPTVVVEALLATAYPAVNPHDAPSSSEEDGGSAEPAPSDASPAEPAPDKNP